MQTVGGKARFATHLLVAAYFVISMCGTMTSLAISLYLSHLGNAEGLVAGVLVSGALAQVFLSPLLTPLFDSFNAVVVAPCLLALEMAVLAFLGVSHAPVSLILGNLIVSTLSGVSVPALFVIAEGLVPENGQVRVYSLLDTARLCGGFIGPLLAGVLLDQSSLALALYVEAAALAGTVVVLFVVRLLADPSQQHHHVEAQGRDSYWRSLMQAPSLLFANPASREALTSIWVAIVFTSIYNVSLVFYTTKVLGVSGFIFALVAQAFIVGRIIGARAASRIRRETALKTLVASGFLMGICIALPGIFPSLYLCVPCFAVAGLCNALQVGALRLVVVAAVPEEAKPKALSTMGSVNSSAMFAGYLVGAPVVAAVGPAAALIVSGLGTSFFTVAPTALRRVRRS